MKRHGRETFLQGNTEDPRTCREDCLSLTPSPSCSQESPQEKGSFSNSKKLCPTPARNPFPSTRRHARPASGFRCKQLFGPEREWPGRELARRAWRVASRGGTKAALSLNLPAVSASSSPPPDITGPRSTENGEAASAISISSLACGLRRAASLRIRFPHLLRSGRLPSCRSAGDLAAAEAGRMRGGKGRFNLCPPEAASLAALRAVLPAGLGCPGRGCRSPEQLLIQENHAFLSLYSKTANYTNRNRCEGSIFKSKSS
ncbi:uncharacterized protein [Bos indicus]|uniref:Uncharacterized protein n=1 Tax=Bos indicus TaxID=9915 RepID=A0ABM4TH24_BOSIN|nr:uncharacterized protein LOC132342274 [Bos taurus]XP_061295615.1 uncharacterized protein LOC133261047 [Bos javanicus]